MSKYGHRTDNWKEAIIDKIGGEEAADAFLRDEFVVIQRIRHLFTIDRTTPFDASTFISRGFTTWMGKKSGDGLSGVPNRDRRSLALNQIDLEKIEFKTYIPEGKTAITGEDRLKAVRASGDIRLDAKVGQALCQELGQKSLRWLYDSKKVTWMEFAEVLRFSSDCRRSFLYLCRNSDGSWDRLCHWLVNDRDASHPVAVLSNST